MKHLTYLFLAGLILLLAGCGEPTVGATQPLDSDNPDHEQLHLVEESLEMYADIEGETGEEEEFDEVYIYDDEQPLESSGQSVNTTDEVDFSSLDVDVPDDVLQTEEAVPIATPRPTPTPTPVPMQNADTCPSGFNFNLDGATPLDWECLALYIGLEDYQANLCNMNPNLQERRQCYIAAAEQELMDMSGYTDAMEDLMDLIESGESNIFSSED